MKFGIISFLLLAGSLAVSPAAAQEQPADPEISSIAPDAAAPSERSPLVGPIMAMYAGYGMLQVLDAHSTLSALDNRGTEANPFVRSLASSPARLIAFKAGSTVGLVYLTERLRKKHPAAALALAIGVNSLQAYVVMHNYRVARK